MVQTLIKMWVQHQLKLQDKQFLNIGADLGIALDGDADRVVMIDEKGGVIDGDQLLALIANTWHAEGLLKGGAVVGTVMTNLGF
jgi:phosphoglucosamine mutase